MCKSRALKALVQERLTAAADEIFALFERTIAEFEVELRRSKEENQKKQELVKAVLRTRVVLLRESALVQTTSPGAGLNPGLNQDLETLLTQIKKEPEEPRVKEEEEQRPIPEYPAVCVNTEESSLLQQRQTELKEETQGENFSTETRFHPETERESSDTDNDDDWEPEAAVDHNYPVQSETKGAAAQNSPQNKFVQVKTEESLLQQRQTEIKEETQEEDVSTEQREETHFHLKTESDLLRQTMMTTGDHSAVQKLLEITTTQFRAEQVNKTLNLRREPPRTMKMCQERLKELRRTGSSALFV
ncbi:hypothetical protein WMY93_010069 [Mugilogobius chulae]|uniref:Uncharacterized protein n=1 Tax=Mugilogobius chulae TaxID=88201 RepID=A0AAW0P6R2_9GOBI